MSTFMPDNLSSSQVKDFTTEFTYGTWRRQKGWLSGKIEVLFAVYRAELSKTLSQVLPQGLTRYFFTTSGTEANEAAFKIAPMVTGQTEIISRFGG
jgi:acetylornithine/succinyldiaminopimelate/putrescine aminotransferase